jgi:hypothetical protein
LTFGPHQKYRQVSISVLYALVILVRAHAGATYSPAPCTHGLTGVDPLLTFDRGTCSLPVALGDGAHVLGQNLNQIVMII